MNAISGEYTSFKHIKTRKAVVLEIEVPEENFTQVIEVLGMPIGGQSKPVGVALLDTEAIKPKNNDVVKKAVMLCKDQRFWNYCDERLFDKSEDGAKGLLYTACDISSRSDLANNDVAIARFEYLLKDFEEWKLQQQYSDNLNRI